MNKKSRKIAGMDLLKLLILRDTVLNILVNRAISKFKSGSQTLILAAFSMYFFVRLGMLEKIFTFVISGKVVGTDYIVNLGDVIVASSAILLTILTRLVSRALKTGKQTVGQKKRIELRSEKRYPLELSVKTA